MALKLITPPAVEPVSLAEAKAHLRVDHTDDDDLITAMIAAARERIDARNGLQRALVTQTWDLILDAFPGCSNMDWWSRYGTNCMGAAGEIMLPFPPLRSVTGVYYFDADSNEQTVSSDDYSVDDASEPGWVVPNSAWPGSILSAINAVRIRFVCGYAPSTDSPPDLAANVPNPIKAAIKLTVGHLYANRESVVVGSTAVEIPQSAQWLLEPYKVFV